MNSSELSPMPWSVNKRGAGRRVDIIDQEFDSLGQIYLNDHGKKKASTQRCKNAVLVMTATQTHEKLVTALHNVDRVFETDATGLRNSGLHQAVREALAEVEQQESHWGKVISVNP